MDALLAPAQDLARPNHLGDPAISRFLAVHLDRELAAQTHQTGFEQAMQRHVSDALSDGPPAPPPSCATWA